MKKRYFIALRINSPLPNSFLFEYGCYLFSSCITSKCVLRDYTRLRYHVDRFFSCNTHLLGSLYVGVIFDNKYYTLIHFDKSLRFTLDSLFLDLDSYIKFPLPKNWSYIL